MNDYQVPKKKYTNYIGANLMNDYRQFKDKHKGERGIVVANGPGLENIPMDVVSRYTTLGCNRITYLLPDFAPTYYSCLGYNQMDTPEKRDTMTPL